MVKAAAGAQAGARRGKSPARCCTITFAACAASAAIHAQALSADDVLVAQARTDQQPLRMEIRSSAVPRLDGQDSGFQAPRVDISFATPDGRGLSPLFGLGGVGPAPNSPAGQAQRPFLDFGVRLTHALHNQRVDITAWRRINAPDDAYTLAVTRQPLYGARLELDLAPASKSGFALDHGFIGMQLEGGARITIKRKDGHPMVYYRTAF
jgi:hypothetical protein